MSYELSPSNKMKAQHGLKIQIKNWWKKLEIKSAISHIGLLIALMTYTIVGGLIFRELEYPAEQQKQQELEINARAERSRLVSLIVNNTDVLNMEVLVSLELQRYELALQEAVTGGLQVGTSRDVLFQAGAEHWSVLQAVFFSSTILTTIGYGNTAPVTFWGRVFCICYAMVGIPLTLTVIADWGRLFASSVSGVTRRFPRLNPAATEENDKSRGLRRALYALAAIVFLFIYLSAGAGLFMLWEEDWTFFDGFYFCFITMTTIGFGDLVPKKPKYMLLCTLYILVGLALTSTIIELVRREYAQSWRRLQALSGPLADTLRRIGESAGGHSLDITAFQQDLRRVLTVVSMPKWSSGGNSSNGKTGTAQREWEQAMEAVLRDITTAVPPPAKASTMSSPIVQIVIYESSV